MNTMGTITGFPANGWAELSDLASEEGAYMSQFMRDVLILLKWPVNTLRKYATNNRQSYRRAASHANDNPCIALYLTGDNTRQPGVSLAKKIAYAASDEPLE